MNYLLTLLLLFTTAAHAEALKPFIPAEPAMKGFWWPVYIDTTGEQQENIYGLTLGDYPTAADGTVLNNIETVIYARALFKQRMPGTTSLKELIEDEQRQSRKRNPGVEIRETEPVMTAEGNELRSYTYFPSKDGSWERVSYSEEGEFYLLFTIRSQNQQRYQQDQESYISYIRKYRKPLINSTRQFSARQVLLKRREEELRGGRKGSMSEDEAESRLN